MKLETADNAVGGGGRQQDATVALDKDYVLLVATPRFKTLITHCSVWNFESMWGTTDELWFDEYEHGGCWRNWSMPPSRRTNGPATSASLRRPC